MLHLFLNFQSDANMLSSDLVVDASSDDENNRLVSRNCIGKYTRLGFQNVRFMYNAIE